MTIRLRKSVLFRRMSCAMLSRFSSSCSTSLSHSLTFALVQMRSLPFPNTSKEVAQSPDFHRIVSWVFCHNPSRSAGHCCAARAQTPPCPASSRRHLPSFPNCLTCSASARTDQAHAFLGWRIVPTFHAGIGPNAVHNSPREDFCSIIALHFTPFTSS